jgi:hypothetical protein
MRYQTYRSGRPGQADTATDALARGLGWFSIGLGLAELLAPGRLAGALGMQGKEALIQGYGAREIATGVGILAAKDPTPWIWGRVAGDALDLATLATEVARGNRERQNLGIAIAAVAGVTALDILCAQTLSSETTQPQLPLHDYSDRSGLPRAPDAMRGAALDTFETPEDYRTPAAMRPYPLH